MKSATQLLKLVGFLLLMQWLCSCNNHVSTIKLIHSYNDSIGIAKVGLIQIRYGRDSISDAYSREYPITAFAFTRKGALAREAFLLKERQAFEKMSAAKTAYNNKNAKLEWTLIGNIGRYRAIIDSLKIELKK